MLTVTFLVAQTLILTLATAAGGGVLVWRARRAATITIGEVARAGVWAAGAAGLATMVGMLAGIVHAFGVIRMGFLVGVVVVPVLGAGLLIARGSGRLRASALLLVFLGIR